MADNKTTSAGPVRRYLRSLNKPPPKHGQDLIERTIGPEDRSLVVGAILLTVLLAIVATVLVIQAYGAEQYWPEAVGGFSAALPAFLLALWFEEYRRAHNEERAQKSQRKERQSEARVLLRLLEQELVALSTELQRLRDVFAVPRFPTPVEIMQEPLSTGAWELCRNRVGSLVTNYELTSRLARWYDGVGHLRTLLRYGAESNRTLAAYGSAYLVTVSGLLESLEDDLNHEAEVSIAAGHAPGAAVEGAGESVTTRPIMLILREELDEPHVEGVAHFAFAADDIGVDG